MARHGSAETADPAISEANGESAARLGLRMQFWPPAETAGIAEDARWRVKAAQRASKVMDDWKERRLGAFRGLGQRICEAFPGLGLKAACFDELRIDSTGMHGVVQGVFPEANFCLATPSSSTRPKNLVGAPAQTTKKRLHAGEHAGAFCKRIKCSAIRPEHRQHRQAGRLPVRLQQSWKSFQGWLWVQVGA